MKPWSAVAASSEFQAMQPDQQEAARSQYFDQVVAPNAPQDKLNDVRAQFDAATKPSSTQSDPSIPSVSTPEQLAAADQKRADNNTLSSKVIGAADAGLSAVRHVAAVPAGVLRGAVSFLNPWGAGGNLKQAIDDGVATAKSAAGEPYTAKGDEYLGNLKDAVSSLPPVAGPGIIGGLGALAPPALAQSGRAIAAAVTPAISSATPAISNIVSKAATPFRAAGDLYADVRGTRAAAATQDATDAARSTVNSAATSLESTAASNTDLAKKMENVKGQLQSSEAVAPDLATQGTNIRKPFLDQMAQADEARSAAYTPQLDAANAIAVEKEAQGLRVDTSQISKQIDAALEKTDGIPDLQLGLKKIKSSIEGSTGSGKTFAQLDDARRYLNNVAYGSDMNGYDAIQRGYFRDAAKSVDQAMQDFVPEFAAAKDTYRQMSQPLEVLGTKYGKLLSSTEGGLSGNSFNKIADQDLPARVFGKKEGIEQLTEALAGGANATPEAQAAAQSQVGSMVENYVLKKNQNLSPIQRLNSLSDPQMEATLNSVPDVRDKLKQQYSDLVARDETIKSIGNAADSRVAVGVQTANDAASIRAALGRADALAQNSDTKKTAYSQYIQLVQQASNKGIIPTDQYAQTMAAIGKAATLEAKTALARKMAAWAAGTVVGAGVVGGGSKIINHGGQ